MIRSGFGLPAKSEGTPSHFCNIHHGNGRPCTPIQARTRLRTIPPSLERHSMLSTVSETFSLSVLAKPVDWLTCPGLPSLMIQAVRMEVRAEGRCHSFLWRARGHNHARPTSVE